MIRRIFFATATLFLFTTMACAQPLNKKKDITRQDTLRGSITPERAWWDVLKYRIIVVPDYDSRTIKGEVTIVYKVLNNSSNRMQIDLQEPMKIDGVNEYYGKQKVPVGTRYQTGPKLVFNRDGNVYYIENVPNKGSIDSISIQFSGTPRVAKNPPWDGGWIFKKDEKDRPWMSVACQGLGASVWYPCKDYQGDEPDNGAVLSIRVPRELTAVANGRLVSKSASGDGKTNLWTWSVTSPINNYNIIPYIGYYDHFSDTFKGENGKDLSLDYWVLDYDLEKAKKQFGRDVKPMLKSFEYWFGPYPFYDDGYKLVESPHLGMEHQSAVAYGNKFKNGYLGMDLSGSGYGKEWDYIIIHESGHEWFANNISTNDIADMWVHEGFTSYSESLFVESQYGKEAGNLYCQGTRQRMNNDIPVIGPYGVNKEGSGDMYTKGANMLHTIRQVIDNDSLFRSILRGLNSEFYHKTINSSDVEQFMTRKSGKKLQPIFDQYLRTIKIPELEYRYATITDAAKPELQYRWTNVVNDFAMPLKIKIGSSIHWIHPTTEFRSVAITNDDKNSMAADLGVDKNFYVTVKQSQN